MITWMTPKLTTAERKLFAGSEIGIRANSLPRWTSCNKQQKYSKDHDQFLNNSVEMKMNRIVSYADTLIWTVCMQTPKLSSSLVEFW